MLAAGEGSPIDERFDASFTDPVLAERYDALNADPALHGLLAKLRDLGLTLVAIAPDRPAAPPPSRGSLRRSGCSPQ